MTALNIEYCYVACSINAFTDIISNFCYCIQRHLLVTLRVEQHGKRKHFAIFEYGLWITCTTNEYRVSSSIYQFTKYIFLFTTTIENNNNGFSQLWLIRNTKKTSFFDFLSSLPSGEKNYQSVHKREINCWGSQKLWSKTIPPFPPLIFLWNSNIDE